MTDTVAKLDSGPGDNRTGEQRITSLIVYPHLRPHIQRAELQCGHLIDVAYPGPTVGERVACPRCELGRMRGALPKAPSGNRAVVEIVRRLAKPTADAFTFTLECRHQIVGYFPGNRVGDRVDCPLCTAKWASMADAPVDAKAAEAAPSVSVDNDDGMRQILGLVLRCGHIDEGRYPGHVVGDYVPCRACAEGLPRADGTPPATTDKDEDVVDNIVEWIAHAAERFVAHYDLVSAAGPKPGPTPWTAATTSAEALSDHAHAARVMDLGRSLGRDAVPVLAMLSKPAIRTIHAARESSDPVRAAYAVQTDGAVAFELAAAAASMQSEGACRRLVDTWLHVCSAEIDQRRTIGMVMPSAMRRQYRRTWRAFEEAERWASSARRMRIESLEAFEFQNHEPDSCVELAGYSLRRAILACVLGDRAQWIARVHNATVNAICAAAHPSDKPGPSCWGIALGGTYQWQPDAAPVAAARARDLKEGRTARAPVTADLVVTTDVTDEDARIAAWVHNAGFGVIDALEWMARGVRSEAEAQSYRLDGYLPTDIAPRTRPPEETREGEKST